MENNISAHSAEALEYLSTRLPTVLKRPQVGIVCGSGLGGLVDTVIPSPRYEIPYSAIPHFPRSTGNNILSPKDHQRYLQMKCTGMLASFFLDF